MIANRINSKVVYFLLFLLSTSCFADSKDSTQLFGLDKYVLPQYAVALSPAITDNYLQLGTFERLYEFKQPLAKDSAPLLSEVGIQKDPVLKLIESLYYVVPGGDSTLRVPANPQLFSYHLKESTIGKILNELLVPPKTDSELDQMKTKLIRITEDDIIPKGYLDQVSQKLNEDLKAYFQSEELSTTSTKNTKKTEQLKTRLHKVDQQNGGGIEGLWAQLKELDRELEPFIQESKKLKKKAEFEDQRKQKLMYLSRRLYQAQHPDQVPTSPKDAASWPSDEVLAAYGNHNLEQWTQAAKNLDQKVFQELSQLCREVAESLKEASSQIENLQKSLSAIQAKFEKEKEPSPENRKVELEILTRALENLKLSLQPYKANAFVETLIAAVKESRKFDSNYSENFVYHLLMGQALLRSKGYRNSLLEMWKQMPGALSEEGLSLIHPKPPTVQETRAAGTREQDRKPLIQKKIIEHQQRVKDFLAGKLTLIEKQEQKKFYDWARFAGDEPNPDLAQQEKALYVATKKPDQSIPAIAMTQTEVEKPIPLFNQSFKNVPYKIGGYGPEVTSSDCCEASFLTAFQRLLLNRDTDSLDSEKSFRFPTNSRKEIKDFLTLGTKKQIFDPTDLNRRSRWKELTSNLPKVEYFQDIPKGSKQWNFDLRPSIDNFIELTEHFFGINEEYQVLFDPPPTTRTQKLNRICKVFNCKFKIDPPDEPPPTIPWEKSKITFYSIYSDGEEGRELFSLQISPLHCWVYQPSINNSLSNAPERFYGKLWNDEEEKRYLFVTKLSNKSLTAEELQIKYEKHRKDRWHPKLTEKQNLETFFEMMSSALTNNDSLNFLYATALAKTTQENIPHSQKYTLPLVLNTSLDSTDRVIAWAMSIFSENLENYIPFALKLLYALPLDPYAVGKACERLFYVLEVEGSHLKTKLSKKYQEDLETVTRRLIMSKPEVIDRLLNMNTSENTVGKNLVNQWVREMREYFQKHKPNASAVNKG